VDVPEKGQHLLLIQKDYRHPKRLLLLVDQYRSFDDQFHASWSHGEERQV